MSLNCLEYRKSTINLPFHQEGRKISEEAEVLYSFHSQSDQQVQLFDQTKRSRRAFLKSSVGNEYYLTLNLRTFNLQTLLEILFTSTSGLEG